MKSHYIKDSNKQYSIREDGEVIRHYKFTWAGNITKVEDYIMTKYGEDNAYHITISINQKNISWSINTLLLEYFKFKFCKQCSTRIVSNIKCKVCIKKNIYAFNTSNRYRYKEDKTISGKNRRDAITKDYAASLLGIPTEDLTKELYQLKKITLKTKRICQQKQRTIQN
jgi:hypothetical protein